MTDWPHARDRLRELLDAVLDEENRTLGDMADDAYASPYHFNRLLSRDAGEPPVAMRRRVMLERAAWQLKQGSTVTDAAFEAGYESVEGFARAFAKAFGHPPSETVAADRGHWLSAPNGIHFHPPFSLWVHTTEEPMNPLTEQLVQHDVDDTRALLDRAKQLSDSDYTTAWFPGATVLRWDGVDDSIQVGAGAPGVDQGGLGRGDRGPRHPAAGGDVARRPDRPARERLGGAGSASSATSTVVAPGRTGSSTPSASRPRASCWRAWSRTC